MGICNTKRKSKEEVRTKSPRCLDDGLTFLDSQDSALRQRNVIYRNLSRLSSNPGSSQFRNFFNEGPRNSFNFFYGPANSAYFPGKENCHFFNTRETTMLSNRSQTEISITTGTYQTDSSFPSPDCTTLCTPIRTSPFTQGMNELRKSLLLKRNTQKKIYDVRKKFVGDIYTLDYLEDIFKVILINEEKILLEKGFLNTFNPENKYRLKTVNWLLSIQQVYLQFTESDFYLAINFMDHILARVKVPRNIYQLLALTSLWIATKLTGTLDIDASDLLMVSGVFTPKELNLMERKMMEILGFRLHTLEPTICIFYYLRNLNLHNNELIELTSLYILDCLALTTDFSSTPISKLTAAVISFSLKLFRKRSALVMYREFLMRKEIPSVESVEKQIEIQLKIMNCEIYIAREPYMKYTSENMLCVSEVVERRLRQLSL